VSPPQEARPPIPAATLLLVRDGAAGLEVLMMERHGGSSFAAGALVFPGGAVQSEDSLLYLQARCRALPTDDPVMAAAAVAAIRETFEECGILLARRTGETELVSGALHERLVETYQAAVAATADGWSAMVDAEGLELACDLVVPFAHWITPADRPKRFDARFLLAPAPSDQRAVHDRREAVDAQWFRPADVVAGGDDGRYRLVFATRMNLVKLGAARTVANALAAARASSIVTVTPRLEDRPEGRVFRIPMDAGYGVDAVPVGNIVRA
jgi:8-oxo-dGTP pyrophosphatase MutT (NUDIX family)